MIVVLLVMASSLLMMGARATSAQSPTAIAIPTATAEGCEDVAAYLKERQRIMRELLVDMEAIFPQVATPIMEHGDELFVAVFSMTPDQANALAQAYDQTADKIAQIEAPPVAAFYNSLQVDLYHLSADVFKETGKTDISTAGDKFEGQLTEMGNAVLLAGAAATGVCPAFGDVVTFDQTQATL